jgi:hypothetical protein
VRGPFTGDFSALRASEYDDKEEAPFQTFGYLKLKSVLGMFEKTTAKACNYAQD